jgi:hypothetical protein
MSKNKKFDFAIVDNLGTWTNENGQELLEKEILAAETINAIEVYPGVKYVDSLKMLETDALIQAAACGTPTTSGSTTLSKKDVSVKSYMVYETLCPADINSTSLQLSQRPGWNEELGFEAAYVAQKIKQIQKKMENKLWVNASGSTEFAGFLNQFDADGSVVTQVADFTTTGLTDANFIALFDSVIAKVPEEIIGMDDLTMFMGKDLFRKLSRAWLNSNNVLLTKFNFNGVDYFEYPGSEFVKILPVNGLNVGNNTDARIVITPASNLLYVCDLNSEEEYTKLWWSDDDQIVKFITHWKSGVAYKFSEYVVVSKKS